MTDHIIQKRDLIEMLKPYPDDVEVVVDTRTGEDSHAILEVVNGYDNRRRVGIVCEADDQSELIEEQSEKISALKDELKEATDLLECLLSIADSGGFTGEAMTNLVKDVDKFVNP